MSTPVRENYNTLLIQMIVLGIFLAFGIVGNTLILVTGVKQLLRVPNLRSQQDYRTSFITNLAVADILILVYGVPIHLAQEDRVPFSVFVCRFLVPLRDALSLTSILTIMAISVERAIAILSPFSLETLRHHTKYVIVSLWITAYLLGGLPPIFLMKSTADKRCVPKWNDVKLARLHQTLAASLVTIPGLITTFCYIFCLRSLQKFRQRRKSCSESTGIEQWTFVKQTRRVSYIAIVLVVVYWLCNLPIIVYSLTLHHRLISPSKKEMDYVRAVLVCLMFGVSVINPIVLITMSPLYGRSASGCFHCLLSKRNTIFGHNRRQRHYSKGSASRSENTSSIANNEFALVSRRQSDI